MIWNIVNTYSGEFEFSSDHAESVKVTLKAGVNEFTAPCFFDELTRFPVSVCLKRASDGIEFKRRYPVIVTYEPIVIKFSLLEFRTNFYPGQDHSKIVVSGWGLDNTKLQIRNAEESTVSEIAVVKTEEFSVTYLLKDAISPDGLRLDFKSKRVELYEMEVF